MSMEKSAAGLQAHEFVLSNLSPSVAQRRFALGVVLVLLVVFVIVAGPLSGLPLRRVDAFIPAYGTAIFVIDSITAAPALLAVFRPTLACAPRSGEWLFPDGAHRNSLDAHISRRIGAGGRPARRPPEYGLALCPVARGLRPVRDRLYTAEGCRSDGVAVATLRSCEDPYDCRISHCARLLCNSFRYSGPCAPAAHHARHGARFLSLVLRDRTHGGIIRRCACLAMAAAPLGARSLADVGLVRIHHRDRPHRLSYPVPL